jgi:hypothetical protein
MLVKLDMECVLELYVLGVPSMKHAVPKTLLGCVMSGEHLNVRCVPLQPWVFWGRVCDCVRIKMNEEKKRLYEIVRNMKEQRFS